MATAVALVGYLLLLLGAWSAMQRGREQQPGPVPAPLPQTEQARSTRFSDWSTDFDWSW